MQTQSYKPMYFMPTPKRMKRLAVNTNKLPLEKRLRTFLFTTVAVMLGIYLMALLCL